MGIYKGSTCIAGINLFPAGQAALDNKANISLDNLSSAGKAKIAVKQYLSTEIYNTNDIVLAVIDDEVSMYKSIVDNNVGNPLTDTTKWEVINLGGGGSSSRNIGEIIPSILPLTDASLHLLDGALITSSSIYSDFIDHIASLTTNYSNLFVTESDWQTSVSAYGVCGKFVYDSTNSTVRLPKITGIVEGTTDMTALGDLIEAGLPNITGKLTIQNYRNNTEVVQDGTGALYQIGNNGIKQNWGTDYVTNATNVEGYETGFDASRSSSIYSNSNTVQPQTIKILFYICITANVRTGYTRASDLVIDKSSPSVALKNTDFDYTDTTAPEAQKTIQYAALDKNSNYIGTFYHDHDSSNNMTTGFTSIRSVNNQDVMANFGIGVNSSGVDFAYGTAGVQQSITNWAFPKSNSAQMITLGATEATYTAPFDGWFCLRLQGSAAGGSNAYNLTADPSGRFVITFSYYNAGEWRGGYIPVKKGDVVMFEYFNLYFTAGEIFWLPAVGG